MLGLSRVVLDLSPVRASRAFRDLWLGSSAAALGGQFLVVAVLYQVGELTGDPLWTGVIGLARAIPLIVFGLVVGALADAADRRTRARWTTVGERAGQPRWPGVIGLARAIRLIVFGLVGGALADAADRRTIVRWTTVGQLVMAAGLAAQAAWQIGSLALLLGLVAAQATCAAL